MTPMSDNIDTLQEMIGDMQAMQAAQEAETQRLRRRLQWLENRRREFFNIVAQNGSDQESCRKLDETEQQLAEINQMLLQGEADLKQSLIELRRQILDLRNQELSRIERKRDQIRSRRDKIRGVLLPEAQKKINRLQEEDTTLVQKDQELQQRMRMLIELDQFTSEVA
jgi:hypothetical protein